MQMLFASLKLPRILRRETDPWWDFFINSPPTDPNNLVAASLPRMSEGRVFPVKSDLHSPVVTSDQIKELATFLGADECKIVSLLEPASPTVGPDSHLPLPFAVVCALRSEHDPKRALGIGGQAPALTAGFVSFLVSAYIRELGYQGTRTGKDHAEELAVAAGMGVMDSRGRLRQKPRRSYLYVADIIRTDLPLAADAEVVSPWPLTS
jgi:hypothetical protein